MQRANAANDLESVPDGMKMTHVGQREHAIQSTIWWNLTMKQVDTVLTCGQNRIEIQRKT